MTKINQIWKCNVCGNIIEILHEGADRLVCCEQPMVLQEENKVDAAAEKHVPVIDGKMVNVGSVDHPMDEDHYIEWIEAVGENGERSKIFLKPGDEPKVEFCFDVKQARAYCNLHLLWIGA
jgi:superoxide reductase